MREQCLLFLGDGRLRYKHQWGKGLTTSPPVGSSLWRHSRLEIQGRHFGAQCEAAPAICRSQVSGGSALLGSDLSHLDFRTFRAKVFIVIRKDSMTTSKMLSGNSCRLVVVLCVFGSVRHAGAPRLVSEIVRDVCDHVQQTCTRGDVLSVGTVTSWLPVVQSGCGISSGQMRTSSDSQKLRGSTSTTSSSAI